MSTVISSYNPQTRIPTSGSFSFLPRSLRPLKDSRFNVVELDRLLRATMQREMQRKGYRFGTPQDSDLLVAYVVVLENQLDDAAISSRYGFKVDWSAAGTLPGIYEKGALIVDIFNGRTMLPVWRGCLHASVAPDLNEDLRRQRLSNAAVSVLSSFSPSGR